MAYTYELPNITGGGFDSGITGIVSIIPEFIPIFLFSIYLTVMIGGMLAQKSRTGYSDMPMWSTLGALTTLLLALPMTLTGGIIEPTVVTIIIIVTIMSALWLFLSKGRNEI